MSITTTRVQALDLVTEDEAAPEVGLKPKTLANMRSRGEGPPYVRVSPRAIRYSRKALAAWVAERTVTPEARLT